MAPQPIPVRVLVIDDDPMSRDLLRLLLQAEGYEVQCADSGEAALANLHQPGRAPGLILADAQMPGIAGGRLADELRRACPPQTLLLAMSGSRPHREAVSRFDGFLLKPFTMAQVASALMAGGTLPAAASNRDASRQPPETCSAQAAAGDSSGGVPVLDWAIHGKLAALMTASQLREIYSLCATDVRKRIAAMRRMAAERDDAGLAREAHAIKGSCGMLGATELRRLAAELEVNSLEAVPAEGEREVNSLDELAAACDRLERILGSRV